MRCTALQPATCDLRNANCELRPALHSKELDFSMTMAKEMFSGLVFGDGDHGNSDDDDGNSDDDISSDDDGDYSDGDGGAGGDGGDGAGAGLAKLTNGEESPFDGGDGSCVSSSTCCASVESGLRYFVKKAAAPSIAPVAEGSGSGASKDGSKGGGGGGTLIIHRATYGSQGPERDQDYTAQVAAMVRDNCFHVDGNIHKVLGDPEPGVKKAFAVSYSFGGGERVTAWYPDAKYEQVHLPPTRSENGIREVEVLLQKHSTHVLSN
jgi:hypothetical protein